MIMATTITTRIDYVGKDGVGARLCFAPTPLSTNVSD